MMSERSCLRLGTRGSPLALTQTEWVAARIRERHPEIDIEIRKIRTTGDRERGPLREIGGKGLFIKEIEQALLAGEVDAGIHSMKDLPAALPESLGIVAVPAREDPRDALITSPRGGLDALRQGARIGTGSLRRQALLRHRRPDVEVVDLRGNVETRIGKWRSGELDAVVLAVAGIRRLGLRLPEAEPLPPEQFLPAIGQGAIAIEAARSSPWRGVLAELDHPPSACATVAERAFLHRVGGDCKTPVAAYATVSGGRLHVRGLIADPSGRTVLEDDREGALGEAESIGKQLADALLGSGGREILAEFAG